MDKEPNSKLFLNDTKVMEGYVNGHIDVCIDLGL
jgi:hypothetical protein